MRHFRVTLVFAFSMLLLISTASAQQAATTSVPNLIRYSGTLKDAQGAASTAPAVVGVTFAIYKQQDGGASVWQETQNVSLDASGQYSVILGSTTATGLPDDLFSQQEQRWLGIQVQGQEEQARVLLVSVPYAFKAHEAETLGGLPASAFVQALTTTGRTLPDGTAVNALGNAGRTRGTADGKGASGDQIYGPCTVLPGYITYWDNTGALCASSFFQNATTGNIGIKNLAPSTPLDVNGAINSWKWYDISKLEWAFAGVGFQANPLYNGSPDPTQRDTFVGVGAGTTLPFAPPVTPLTENDNTFLGYYAGSPTKPNGTAGTGSGNTFTGSQAGASNVIGSQNTFMGWQAGFNNTTDANTFLGTQAGFSNVSGVQNTFTGWQAGFVNLANNNSFYGYRAGFHNSNGAANTFLGLAAGFRNDTGNNNTYIGTDAAFTNSGNINNNTFTGFEVGENNTASNGVFYGYKAGHENTADGNSFFGFSAGMVNTSGNSNTFLGNLAGTVNTTGSGDTFVGDSAGAANVTNNNNTFTGQNAGKANTADGNSFYGYNAGLSNTTGQQNVFVGISAGSDNTTGGGNTYVGWEAGIHSAPGTGTCCNTFVGNGAGLGTSGSGTLSGGGNSFFGHRAGEATTTGGKNTYSGFWSGLVNQTGSFNSFYGDQSGQSMVSGDYNTFLGISAAGSTFTAGNFNVFVGAFAGDQENNVDNSIEIGNNGSNHYGSGSIQIGTMGTHVNKTYMAGFAPSTMPPNVYYNTTTGQLFATTGGGGGGMIGPCAAGTNWITRWTSTTTVDCSHIYEDQSNFNVGIDGMPNAAAQLDVVGGLGNVNTTDTRSSYMIGLNPVLSILGTRNLFVGAGTGSGGDDNTFAGANAGNANTSGTENTFSGAYAGFANQDGALNVYLGYSTGSVNVSGLANTFLGHEAGSANIGSYNTFVGKNAGTINLDGNGDIYVDNSGNPSDIHESHTIRIGTEGTVDEQQNATYIAGIYNAPMLTEPVCINSSGKLARCSSSSRRFKDQIANMDDSSNKLFQLRPVTFFYKAAYDDGSHTRQYGLIAEEVANLFPDMVIYDKDGKPSAVKYQMLAPMLLNELQKEHAVVMTQQDQLQTQLQQIKAQRQEIDGLKRQLQLQNASLQERLQKLESYVETQMKTAADNPPRTTPVANGGLQ